jgi:N-acetylglucosaminyl-diphospho-decaprenol L-rhamnosyltransferase
LSGVAVHWRSAADLAALLAAWPEDPRFELVVVDNSGDAPAPPPRGNVRLLRPGANLGFAGGAGAGAAAARGAVLLFLNPDAHPEPGALAALLAGFAAHPEAAGLAPRLLTPHGVPQFAWQLRRLPSAGTLLAQALLLPVTRAARAEPPAGAAVEQPAGAALALRREAYAAVGGFDAGFHPAWFEDVDLARRLADAGRPLLYWPDAVFRHLGGGTIPTLGFGRFLWTYHRHLGRYLARHHGRAPAALARWLTAGAALARLLLVPLRRPGLAPSRRAAAAGYLALAAGGATGWRRPAAWADRAAADREGGG